MDGEADPPTEISLKASVSARGANKQRKVLSGQVLSQRRQVAKAQKRRFGEKKIWVEKDESRKGRERERALRLLVCASNFVLPRFIFFSPIFFSTLFFRLLFRAFAAWRLCE
jgi:hypothetical protein